MSSGPTSRDAALFYADTLGWRVFPIWWVTDKGHCGCGTYNCIDIGKHPIGPCVPHGCTDGTTDLDLIGAWWDRFQHANVGIATGKRSGIFVIDIDPRHRGDESIEGLQEMWGELPDTVECLTGGGGTHLFFAYPPEDSNLRVGNKQNLGAPKGIEKDDPRRITGVDCRGSGGYVVAAPSVHVSKNRYEWEASSRPGKIELAQCPNGWLDAITTVSTGDDLPNLPTDDEHVETTPEAAKLLEEQCELLRNAPDGAKHATRFDAGKRAGRLIAGGLISTGAALRVMEQAARENSKAPDWKIRKTLTDAIQIGMQWPWEPAKPQRELPPPPTDEDWPGEAAKTARHDASRGRQRHGGTADEASHVAALDASEDDSGAPPAADRHLRVVGDDEVGDLTDIASKPVIFTNSRDFIEIVQDTWEAVTLSNQPTPYLFRRGSGAMAVARVTEDNSCVQVEPLEKKEQLFSICARVARWRTRDKEGNVKVTRPDKDVAIDMLCRPLPNLPLLEATPAAPMFDYDGHLIDAQGYSERARAWTHYPPGFSCGKIPLRPLWRDVQHAVELFRDHLLIDFPFAAESDFAHTVAAILLPFCRRMVKGPTPIHMIEATTQGTGKGLLANVIHMIAQGTVAPITTLDRNPDNVRKKITSILHKAQPIVLLDNLEGKIASPDLAAVVTSETWSDRILGQTAMIELPNHAVWLATANNASMNLDIARRCIRLRLESPVDRPYLRTDFKHDPLEEWVMKHRPELVRSCLTMIQYWIAQGRVQGESVLGSFVGWARTIGGILDAARIPGFLANQTEMYEIADSQTGDWREFIDIWWQSHGTEPTTVSDLRVLADEQNMIPSVLGDKAEKTQSQRLGKALLKLRGRIFGELQIHCGKKGRRRMYALTIAGEQPTWGDRPPQDDLDQEALFDAE
jgi:hypothetical protein